MNPSDGWQLWQQACRGDAASATRLVRQLTPQALGLALQIVRQHADAEDMVQEAFLRLWNSDPQSDRGATVATYFNTIVINRCKTLLAKRRELATDHETLTTWSDQQQMAQDPGTGAEEGAVPAAALTHAMQRLPARQRMALAMWAYADADVPAIASAMELEPNAAHQLLHRAKQGLRQLLTGVRP